MTAVLDELAALVACESPSSDAEATRQCARVLDDIAAERVGARAEWVDCEGRTHLRWTWGRPRVLLLGHLDTVWPLGTTARWPFDVDGDRATGPGSFDMKAGLVQCFSALSSLDDLDGVAVLVTSDEEVGSTTSRRLVEDTARGLDAVFVLEPSIDGALKVARKGVATFRLDVTGRAAHAGLDPENGINAGVELARHVLAISELGDSRLGTTVTPTVLNAGTTANTVPAAASVLVDVRVPTVGELDRVSAALRALTPTIAGASLEVTTIAERPPFEPEMAHELFAMAEVAYTEIAPTPLAGVAVGGGSDGNITAAIGVPTLDGLGAVGGGAHAEGEWVDVPGIPQRAALVASLVRRVLARGSRG